MRNLHIDIELNSQRSDSDREMVISSVGYEFNREQFDQDNSGWIEVVPAGVLLRGLDGREYLNESPDAVVDSLNASKVDAVLDVEHSTQLLAPKGLPAPAYGWFKKWRVADGGGIEGYVELNALGRAAVAGKHYRYVSPVIRFNKLNRQILYIPSVALTTMPNLTLESLNRQQEQSEVNLLEKLLKKLGLSATATEEEALNTILGIQQAADALNSLRTTLKLDKDADVVAVVTELNRQGSTAGAGGAVGKDFVPMDDYKALKVQFDDLNRRVETASKDNFAAAVATELNRAQEARKISPASRKVWEKSLIDQQALDNFKELMGTTPQLLTSQISEENNREDGLTSDDIAMCRSMGISEKDYQAAKAAEGAR